MKKIIGKRTKKKILVESSKFTLDLAKLVFAGLVLAGVKDLDIQVYWVIGLGVFSLMVLVSMSCVCFILGNYKK